MLPDPFSLSVALRSDDEFIVVANSALWEVVTPEDAVEEIYEIGSPVVAAKHLQDLAQVRSSQPVTQSSGESVFFVRISVSHGGVTTVRPGGCGRDMSRC